MSKTTTWIYNGLCIAAVFVSMLGVYLGAPIIENAIFLIIGFLIEITYLLQCIRYKLNE